MRNVRIWFKKDLECRYISHLDLNRCMLRALNKSRIPIWHTEGFNPHPFATFPLPLSLGFRGINECMDIKLVDDGFDLSLIPSLLNVGLPRGIRAFDATEAVMKAGSVAYAEFTIKLSSEAKSDEEIRSCLESLLAEEAILIEKRTKKGTFKTVDIKPAVKSFEISKAGAVELTVTLAAGSFENVNPNLLVAALGEKLGAECFADITRNELFASNMERFR